MRKSGETRDGVSLTLYQGMIEKLQDQKIKKFLGYNKAVELRKLRVQAAGGAKFLKRSLREVFDKGLDPKLVLISEDLDSLNEMSHEIENITNDLSKSTLSKIG